MPVRIMFSFRTAVVSDTSVDKKYFISIFISIEVYLKGFVTPKCEPHQVYFNTFK